MEQAMVIFKATVRELEKIQRCRVRYFCRRSGLLNMRLLADLILINS